MSMGSTISRGCRLLPVAALLASLLALAPALAQRAVPQTPKPPFGGGTGGGAGHVPTMPDFRPAPMAPAAPTVTVPAAPAAPVPAPSPIIRFRCEVAPGASTCQEQPTPDGGGEETCDCARDFCYQGGTGARVCEKAAN